MRSILPVMLRMMVLGVVVGHTIPAQSAQSPVSRLRQIELQVRSVLNDRDPQKAMRLFALQFGIKELAKRCLTDYWADLDVIQQQQYVFLFSKLMYKNLETRLESFSEAHVNYRQKFIQMNRNEDGTWTARSRVESPDYAGTVEYIFMDFGRQLELVDYVLDGISLSRNYRGRFNHIMRNRGYTGLLAELNAKLGRVVGVQ